MTLSQNKSYHILGRAMMEATVLVPDNCRDETLCELLRETLNSGSNVVLRGGVTSTNVSLNYAIPKDVKVYRLFL